MMEPQRPLSTDPPSAQTMLPPAIAPAAFDFQKISQTILKLRDWDGDRTQFEWTLDPDRVLPSYQELRVPSEFSPAVLEAWERLIEIVAHLRSPLSGWPPNLPQIPENIAPYVTEEAGEVLEALQLELIPQSLAFSHLETSQESSDRYILVKDLIPKLLWYLAKSSYDVMQLLAGIEARVWDGDRGWQKGMLRLTAILTVDAAVPWCLDLATHQPPQTPLIPDATVQSDESYFCKQPIPCKTLVQHFFQEIQDVSEAVRPFLETITVDLLEPGQTWQEGSIQLSFNFDFVSDPDRTEFDREALSHYIPLNSETQLLTPKEIEGLAISPQKLVSEFQARIADSQTITCYYQAVMKEQLIEIIPELQAANKQELLTFQAPELIPDFPSQWDEIDEAIERSIAEFDRNPTTSSISPLNSDHLIFHLVKLACEVVDAMQAGDDEPSSSLVQLKISLTDLTIKLMWYLIRSTYDIMQLVGGITAQVLQPGGVWEKGTLRLLGLLQAHNSNFPYKIDVATGQVYPSPNPVLPPQAILRSNESEFCRELIDVGNLTAKIINELRESSPELAIWIDGMGIEVRSSSAVSPKGGLEMFPPKSELDTLEVVDYGNEIGVDSEVQLGDNPHPRSKISWKSGVLQLSIAFEFIADKSHYSY